jgi:hypothetical protein
MSRRFRGKESRPSIISSPIWVSLDTLLIEANHTSINAISLPTEHNLEVTTCILPENYPILVDLSPFGRITKGGL